MNILLVEDEEAILKLAGITLERAGYQVRTANHPEVALALAKEAGASFDLLITDVMMPGMNGRALAKRVREIFPHIICLFISGYTADVINADGGLELAGHFLEKPFSMKHFVETVQRISSEGQAEGAAV